MSPHPLSAFLLLFPILSNEALSLVMPKQTVLITGGAGFLGINLARYLHARGYAIVSLDLAPLKMSIFATSPWTPNSATCSPTR